MIHAPGRVGSKSTPEGRPKPDPNTRPCMFDANGGSNTITRLFAWSATYTQPLLLTRTATGDLSWLSPAPSVLEPNPGCPRTRSAVCEPAGKRSTRLLPLSATQTLPCGSTSTPAVQALLLPQLKQRVLASRRTTMRTSGKGRVLLQAFDWKLSWPQTSSATASVLNGVLYFSTRWFQKSVT